MENITDQLSHGADAVRQNVQGYVADGEEYVRRNPTRSIAVALGAGFLLAQLPLRYMIAAFLKILFLLIKPATVIYAVSKLIDDVRSARMDDE